MSINSGRTVAFVTLGCAKNEVDSRDMAVKLSGAGWIAVQEPENADVLVVNTCSFIQAATEESIDVILEAIQLPNVSSGKTKLVVAGCLPSRYGEDLEKEIPEASSFVACSKEDDIVEVLDSLVPAGSYTTEIAHNSNQAHNGQLQEIANPFAYVKISDGCDRYCSYCTIPYIRGRYHSFSLEDIQNEVNHLVSLGTQEIILIAQDTGIWGNDLSGDIDLSYLLDQLANTYPSTWFRVMYTQPEGVTERLLDTMNRHSNICNYLDIPFQHCVPHLLKSMNRKGSVQEFLDLIEQIRSYIPDIAIRTTLMCGFPGETEDDFGELCDFVEEAQLDYVGLFAYSAEEGTIACSMSDQVPEDVKQERLQELRDLTDTISSSVIAQRIGIRTFALICGQEEDGQLFGRTQMQAPDVDGVTYVSTGSIGDIVDIEIVDTLLYEMEGESYE